MLEYLVKSSIEGHIRIYVVAFSDYDHPIKENHMEKTMENHMEKTMENQIETTVMPRLHTADPSWSEGPAGWVLNCRTCCMLATGVL